MSLREKVESLADLLAHAGEPALQGLNDGAEGGQKFGCIIIAVGVAPSAGAEGPDPSLSAFEICLRTSIPGDLTKLALRLSMQGTPGVHLDLGQVPTAPKDPPS